MRHEIKLWLVHSIVSVPLNFPYEKFEFYIRNFTSLTPRIVLFLEKSIETFPTLPEQGQIWCYQHVGRFKDTEPVFRVHSENVMVQSMIVQTLLIRLFYFSRADRTVSHHSFDPISPYFPLIDDFSSGKTVSKSSPAWLLQPNHESMVINISV